MNDNIESGTELPAINPSLTNAEVATLKEILVDELEVRTEQLGPGADLKADLGADSLDLVSIVMRVEERFNVTVSDDHSEKVHTVADLCDTLATVLKRSPQ